MMGGTVLHAANVSNASASLMSSTASTTHLVLPIAWVVLIVGAVVLVRSSRHFDKLANAAELFAVSLFYAVHGLAAITVAAVAVAPVYLFAQADSGTRSAIGIGLVAIVAGYAGLTALGYVFRHWLVEPAAENAREAGLIDDGGVAADGD